VNILKMTTQIRSNHGQDGKNRIKKKNKKRHGVIPKMVHSFIYTYSLASGLGDFSKSCARLVRLQVVLVRTATGEHNKYIVGLLANFG
jgi:hypothetical protein